MTKIDDLTKALIKSRLDLASVVLSNAGKFTDDPESCAEMIGEALRHALRAAVDNGRPITLDFSKP